MMERILIKNILENARPLLIDIETFGLKAKKLKELLLKEAEKNKNFDLISGALKGLNEMFEENRKKELLEEIEYSIILLNLYELTSEFRSISIPLNDYSKEQSAKFDEIQAQLKSVIEEKYITTP